MAVNAAFTAQTSNGISSGYAMGSTTAVVEVQQDSVMGEASVIIQACNVDGAIGVMKCPGVRTITLASGYYLRLVVDGVKSGVSTSINATVTT